MSESCNKCLKPSPSLLSATHRNIDHNVNFGKCKHIFCQKCFRKENKDPSNQPKCPCCKVPIFSNIKSYEEALLLLEGSYFNLKATQLFTRGGDITHIHSLILQSIEKYEQARKLNQDNNIINLCLALSYFESIVSYTTERELLVSAKADVITLGINQGGSHTCSNHIYSICLDMISKYYDENGCFISGSNVYRADVHVCILQHSW